MAILHTCRTSVPTGWARLVQMLEFVWRNTKLLTLAPALCQPAKRYGDEEFKKIVVAMGKELLEEDKKKPKKKKVSKTVEERAGEYDESKCHARVWKRMPGDMSFDNLQCIQHCWRSCFEDQTQVDKHGHGGLARSMNLVLKSHMGHQIPRTHEFTSGTLIPKVMRLFTRRRRSLQRRLHPRSQRR